MGTPVLTTHPVSPESLAAKLLEVTRQYRPLEESREILKAQLREFGANTYEIVGTMGVKLGTVQVFEPEVATFKAKVLVVDQAKFEKLSTKAKAELLDTGVVAWEDKYTRDAKAKVETTLA